MSRSMDERFEFLYESRPEKPRESGLTMVIGDGLYNVGGINYVRDLLEFAGAWIDSYKFQRGALGLQPPDLVQEKLALFEVNDVVAFPGGNFLEAAVLDGSTDRYFEALRDVGCPGVEVSTTAIEMGLEEKVALVERADEFGFHIHAEVGKKASETGGESLSTTQMFEEMDACLDAGADLLILEMEQIENSMRGGEDGAAADVLHRYLDRFGKEKLLFEVPLASYYEVMEVSYWFIDRVGVDVNLGNVAPQHVMPLEQQRRGLGQYTFLDRG